MDLVAERVFQVLRHLRFGHCLEVDPRNVFTGCLGNLLVVKESERHRLVMVWDKLSAGMDGIREQLIGVEIPDTSDKSYPVMVTILATEAEMIVQKGNRLNLTKLDAPQCLRSQSAGRLN